MDIMRGEMNENKRDIIIDLVNKRVKGKKVMFYNLKDGKRIKKERICNGAYWRENDARDFREVPNIFMKWDFMIIGTKKDYVVDKGGQIGYYIEHDEKPLILNAELDPYGEEDWS